MDKAELLKVLDMSEDEQWEWLEDNHIITGKGTAYYPDFHGYLESRKATLADLAFRLRDEAIKANITHWQRAMDCVLLSAYKDDVWQNMHSFERWPAVTYFFSHQAKPIHWIIAALIAKGD